MKKNRSGSDTQWNNFVFLQTSVLPLMTSYEYIQTDGKKKKKALLQTQKRSQSVQVVRVGFDHKIFQL